MPIPKPRSGETESEFVSRCMGEIGDEYDQNTALAICYDTFRSDASKWDHLDTVLPINKPSTTPIRQKALNHNSSVEDGEPGWGTVDKTKLPFKAFVFDESGADAEKKSSWRFPHHWVRNGGELNDMGVYASGDMYLHRGGLNAAWAAAQGARSGQRASQAVINHLQRHRRALGLDTEKVTKEDLRCLEKIQEISDIEEKNPVRLATGTFAGVGNYAQPEGIVAGRYPEFEVDEDAKLPRNHREEAADLDDLLPIK